MAWTIQKLDVTKEFAPSLGITRAAVIRIDELYYILATTDDRLKVAGWVDSRNTDEDVLFGIAHGHLMASLMRMRNRIERRAPASGTFAAGSGSADGSRV